MPIPPLDRLRTVAWRTLRDLDARYAASGRASFERGVRGGAARGPAVVARDPAQVMEATAPRGRPMVVHHWATWCAGCLEELPLVSALAARLSGVADVVTVSWDRFQDDGPLEDTLTRVRATLAATPGLPVVVATSGPEALFEALHLSFHQIPQSRVLDADGGVLRSFEGPLTPADLDAICAVLGAPPRVS